jgi:hypothetical protein
MSYAMGNEIIFITGDINLRYLYQRYKKCAVHPIHQLYLFSTLRLQSDSYMYYAMIHSANPWLSWAEGDLVLVVVAVASVVLGVIGREEVGVGALVSLAHQFGPVAAGEGHRQVEAVDDGDVVKVLAVADGELGQRQRRLPGQPARQRAAAVARLAPAGVAVEAAARAAPHPAGGRVRRDVEGPSLAGVQLPTAADRGGSRPHRIGAVVSDVERRCARACREHGHDDEEGCCRRGRH